jgi:putative DNA primase/helicase
LTVQRLNKIQSEDVLKSLNRNADGDASLFIDLHRGRFIYDCAAGRWYKWAGHYWTEDLTDEVVQAVSIVVEVYETEARRQSWLRAKAAKEKDKAETTHRENESALLKRMKLLQSLNRKQEVLVLARSGSNTLACTGEEWDKDPWILAVSNGVIDLKTGELRPGNPLDFNKTAAPTEWWSKDEPCPIWENFIAEIFGGNSELVVFVQRLLGYGITGLSILHIFIILYGIGRNGKGTMLETLRRTLGDYAMKTESELLLEQKYSRQAGSPNSGVLSLRGRRIVWASETSDGRKLNTGKVKELVGGDTLNARAVFGKNHVQFEPSHLLLLLTNSRPSAPASDYALWKRIYLIPFEQSFVDDPVVSNESKADPYLVDKLKSETPGILAWLVRGCLAWQEEGLNPPASVQAATEDYRKDEDYIGKFIDERLVQDKTCSAKAGEAYQAFKKWCDENGLHPVSGKRFGTEMKQRFDSGKDRDGIFYIGIEV